MAEESVYILYDFHTGGLLADNLEAVKCDPPPGFDVDYPHPTASLSQGDIWSNIVKPRLESATRLIAFVDQPNANVAFEVGYTLGQAHPTRVALARLRREIPAWLQQPPFQGFSCPPLTVPSEIRRQIISDNNWFTLARRPQPGREVLFLCPSAGEAYLTSMRRRCRWQVLPASGWSFYDLPERLSGVGAIVWLLLPHEEGEAARDGTANTALAVIAGYAEGCGLPVHVLLHHHARVVVDLMARAQRLEGLPAFEALLPTLAQELEDRLRQTQRPTDTPPVPDEVYRAYYTDCITRWSGERYALDKRFVHLTLLLRSGARGPERALPAQQRAVSGSARGAGAPAGRSRRGAARSARGGQEYPAAAL